MLDRFLDRLLSTGEYCYLDCCLQVYYVTISLNSWLVFDATINARNDMAFVSAQTIMYVRTTYQSVAPQLKDIVKQQHLCF